MAYNIRLDVFEGPLDLLLSLIRENEVDIYDIPIATITDQYLAYITMMKTLNLEVAGDFLVMASTLTYIKSKTLLPKHDEMEDDDAEGEDPRDELVRKLLEYKKFKEASFELRDREYTQTMIFTRSANERDKPDDADLLLEVSVFALIKSFNNVLERLGGGEEYTVTLEEISITDRLNDIIERLEVDENMTFDSLFENDKNRMEVIATFMALLEVIRLKLARAHQARAGGEILIYRAPEVRENDDETPVAKAPYNGDGE